METFRLNLIQYYNRDKKKGDLIFYNMDEIGVHLDCRNDTIIRKKGSKGVKIKNIIEEKI